MRVTYLVIFILLCSSVSALEMFSALEGVKDFTLASLKGDSRSGYRDAFDDIEKTCTAIYDEMVEVRTACRDACYDPSGGGGEFICSRSCIEEIEEETRKQHIEQTKSAAEIAFDYNRQILTLVLPAGKSTLASQELQGIQSTYISCVDSLERAAAAQCDFLPTMLGYNDCGEAAKSSLESLARKYREFVVLEADEPELDDSTVELEEFDVKVAECNAAIAEQTLKCKGSGWMIDVAVSIGDFETGEIAESQYIASSGGCPNSADNPTQSTNTLYDYQTEDKQVICSVNCYTWECNPEMDLPSKTMDVYRDGEWTYLDKLQVGDTVKTGSVNTLEFKFDHLSLSLGTKSTMEVESFDTYNLKEGKLWGWVGKTKDEAQITVKTPNSEYIITGTEFIITYLDGVSKLHLYSGTVSANGEEIEANHTAVTKDGKTETKELEFTGDQWGKLNKTLTIKLFELIGVIVVVVLGLSIFVGIPVGIFLGIRLLIKKK